MGEISLELYPKFQQGFSYERGSGYKKFYINANLAFGVTGNGPSRRGSVIAISRTREKGGVSPE